MRAPFYTRARRETSTVAIAQRALRPLEGLAAQGQPSYNRRPGRVFMSTATPPATPTRPKKTPQWSAAAQFLFNDWKSVEGFHTLEDLVAEEIDDMIAAAVDQVVEALGEGWVRNIVSGGTMRGYQFRYRGWSALDVALGIYYDRGHWKFLNLKESHVYVCVFGPADPAARTTVCEKLRGALAAGDPFDVTLSQLLRPEHDIIAEVAIRLADDDRTGKKFYQAIVETFDEVLRSTGPRFEEMAAGKL
jgi:hypothetical protein